MDLFVKCQREGCTRRATVSPKICIPATGYPRGPYDIGLFTGLKLCRDHCAEVNAVDIATKPLPGEAESPIRRIVNSLTRGKVPPDYQRAYIEAVRVDSEVFRTYERMIDDKEPEAPAHGRH